MSELEAMSHSISSSSSGGPKPSKFSKAATPPTSPKKTRFAGDDKQAKEQDEKFQDLKKGQLLRKIHEYLNSRFFSAQLAHLTPPKESASVEIIESFLIEIRGIIASEAKLLMVRQFFAMGVMGVENMAVHLLKLDHLQGVGKEIGESDEFDRELFELSLDLPDNWVPTAKWRLIFKVFDAFQQAHQYRTQNYSNAPPPVQQQKQNGGDISGRRGGKSEDGIPDVVGNFDSPAPRSILGKSLRASKGESSDDD